MKHAELSKYSREKLIKAFIIGLNYTIKTTSSVNIEMKRLSSIFYQKKAMSKLTTLTTKLIEMTNHLTMTTNGTFEKYENDIINLR